MFDCTNDRLSYGEMLRPYEGYELEFAVACTYSLDIGALLGVTLALNPFGDADLPDENPVMLLRTLIKNSDKLAVFYNAACIANLTQPSKFLPLIDSCVYRVDKGDRFNFHPKIWVLKYTNGKDEYIKFISLSRNMTFDNSLDYAVECVAYVNRNLQHKKARNRGLHDMLLKLAEQPSLDIDQKKNKIKSLADDVLNCGNFYSKSMQSEVAYCEFLPYGFDGLNSAKPWSGQWENFVAVSPFLSPSTVNEIKNSVTGNIALFTRQTAVSQTILNGFTEAYVLNNLTDEEAEGNAENIDLHAKIYYGEGAGGKFLFVGSANATHNAFNGNTEFLLKIKFKDDCDISYSSFIDDLKQHDDKLFVKAYPAGNSQETDNSSAQRKAVLKAVRGVTFRAVECCKSRYNIVWQPNEDCEGLEIALAGINKFVPFSDGILKDIAVKNLSQFFALKFEDFCAVEKLNVEGLPEDRREQAIRNIIDNKSKFIEYISFILDGEYYGGTDYFIDGNPSGEESTYNNAAVFGLYEKMLRCAASDDGRLDELVRVYYVFEKEGDIIPAGFPELIKAAQSAQSVKMDET